MVIDLPPGTGDIQISLAQQVKLSGAVIVSTPQDIALLDVIKAMTMFEKAGVKVLGMVQNMSFWECPDCGRKDHIFGEDGVSLEASKRKLELLGMGIKDIKTIIVSNKFHPFLKKLIFFGSPIKRIKISVTKKIVIE